eukprot:5844939-Prymnesium_polylepis.1
MRHALNGKRAVPQDPKTFNGALLVIINVKRGPDPPEVTTTSKAGRGCVCDRTANRTPTRSEN